MTRTSNYKRAILAYQKTSDCRNGVSKEALMNSQKATKKLANPKRKNKVCKDVVREIITEEDYQQLIEERNELVSKCNRLKEQLKTATYLVRNANSWLKGYYNKDHLVKRHYIVLETLIKRIENYLEKWGVR